MRRAVFLTAVVALAAGLVGFVALRDDEPAPAWRSGFERGGLGEWSYAGGGDDSWGHVEVVRAAEQGIPPKQGKRVVRFEVTPSDLDREAIHAKLYQSFHTGTLRVDSRPPGDVSGSYRAWYYLPQDFRLRDAHGEPDGWINLFQFKNHYWVDRDDEEEASDPLWWLELKSARWARERGWSSDLPDGYPVAWVNHRKNDLERAFRFTPVPLGRWFEIRAELYEGDRVEFFVDGELLDVGRNEEWPVANTEEDPIGFTFGIGSYGPTQSGPVYADEISYTPH